MSNVMNDRTDIGCGERGFSWMKVTAISSRYWVKKEGMSGSLGVNTLTDRNT